MTYSLPPSAFARSDSSRLLALDVLRGLAAILVVIYHYTFEFNKKFGHAPGVPLFEQGQLGVDLFFVISGFVIYMTIQRTEHWLDFVVSRFSRLFPAYWAAVIVSYTVVTVFGLPHFQVSLSEAAVNLTMLEAFFFVPYVDGVYWTLSLELSFYAIVLLLFATHMINRIDIVSIAWIALVIGVHALAQYRNMHLPSRLEILSISQYAHLFIAGMMCYKLWQEGFHVRRASIVALCIGTEWYLYGAEASLLVATFIIAVIAGTKGWFSVITRGPFVFLGAISYSLYLIHQYIGYVILRGCYKAGLHPYLGIMIALAIAIGLATALTFSIERPAMRVIRNWYKSSGRRWLLGLSEKQR